MRVEKFEKFVDETDQFRDHPHDKRLEIAIQGLVSEIGSVVSAVKKETLREGGALASSLAREEVTEELGDVLWYAFAIARMEEVSNPETVLVSDIRGLMEEVGRGDARAHSIHEVLTPERAKQFLERARHFPKQEHPTFSDYQQLAWLTARTEGETLLTVCMTVLSQLGAQMMRHLLPEVELELNVQLKDRSKRVILAEICWHVAAVASLYRISLDDVAEQNVVKNRFRRPDREPTPLHDEGLPEDEQLPRQFAIEIRSIDHKTSKMLWHGVQLGDDLRDNAHQPDGYRFHDVMHLANAAHLGWSPVLRKMMDRKRRSARSLDDVEDGGRAAIVEEAIVKVVHSEAARRAKIREPDVPDEKRQLFPPEEEVPFALLKQVQRLAEGHEVYSNKAWEWENAIRSGYTLFQRLREEGSGRVLVDLSNRSVIFQPLDTGEAGS